ncbi:MAG: hypothetical protein DRN99_01030 [Thermoproteota archaeon]|nr:MAG: hypothetical protein DRN99_01030 [Candidatus Korarchaeota archaeon]
MLPSSVLLIAPYNPTPAGVEVYATEVATRLARTGVRVEVISYLESKKAGMETVYRMPTVSLPLLRGLTFTASASAAASILSLLRGVDVVNAHYAVTSGVAVSLAKLRAPKVLTFHGSDVALLKGVMRPLVPLLLSCTFYVAVSRRLACELAALGFPRERITVIPGGVDFKGLSSIAKIPREEARRAVGLPVHARIILFMAPLIPYKNPLVLLPAFKKLVRSLQDTYLVYCGRGPLAREILKEASGLKVGSRVALIPEVSRDKVPYVLRSADVLVVPSTREAWGLTVLEAMAVGTPVIVSRFAGVSDVLVNWRHAIVVNPHSCLELANAIKAILEDPSLAEYIVKRAISIARKFTWELTAKRYLRLFTHILGDASEKVQV